MRDIRIAAVQFEHRDGQKEENLSRIRSLAAQAVNQGAELVSFHECCVSGYTFVQSLTKSKLAELAEPVPDGPSTRRLVAIAGEFHVPVLAGLFEKEGPKLFNTYVCVTGDGVVAKYRKLHAFIHPAVSSGDQFVVFDLLGCRFGILICYDNNLPENVRITTLMGAEVIFMPHVTGCLPSAMPGRGLVEPRLWDNREADPVGLRMEFNGPKGRGWLMRWLPARAYENGIYAVFTNPVGRDGGQIRNGNAMLLDPFGEVLAECHALGDDIAIGLCTAEKLESSSGRRYLRARRPELYARLTEPSDQPPLTRPGWTLRPAQQGG